MSQPREYNEDVDLNDGSVLERALRAAREAAIAGQASYDLAVRQHNDGATEVNQKIDQILCDRNMDPARFTIIRTTAGDLKIVPKACGGAEPPGSLRTEMKS